MENNAPQFIFVDFKQKRVLGNEDAYQKRLKSVRRRIKFTQVVMDDVVADMEKDYRDKFGFYVRRRETIAEVAKARADARLLYKKTVREKSAGIF